MLDSATVRNGTALLKQLFDELAALNVRLGAIQYWFGNAARNNEVGNTIISIDISLNLLDEILQKM